MAQERPSSGHRPSDSPRLSDPERGQWTRSPAPNFCPVLCPEPPSAERRQSCNPQRQELQPIWSESLCLNPGPLLLVLAGRLAAE